MKQTHIEWHMEWTLIDLTQLAFRVTIYAWLQYKYQCNLSYFPL